MNGRFSASSSVAVLRQGVGQKKLKILTLATPTILMAAVMLGSTFAESLPGNQHEAAVPVSTQWDLDSAGPTQRTAIKSVYLVVCSKANRKGTAFLMRNGILVTDNHVVEGCQSNELEATSPMGRRITFSKIVTDPNRDLALLQPSERLEGGLELGTDISPPIGTTVTTWGFPLIYNGPAPLLSVGYVAGYNDARVGNKTVKHIVVNGAFNPGNSGGPLLMSLDDKVVGIVVWKMRLLPQFVETLITGLSHPSAQTCCAATETLPDGTKRGISNEEATGRVLDEFYKTVQVMIGEATSVSELKDFLHEKESELR
jgi:S1-C subfamily serine protease